jgi:mono/diheme cytochrome c family protein
MMTSWLGRSGVLAVAAAMVFTSISAASAQDDPAAHEYAIYCAKCHGIGGRGDGVYAPKLHTRPRDFTNCAVMAPIANATIVKAIEQGGEAVGLSSEMPSWQGALDDDEIAALAKYIRGFCNKSSK